MYAVPDETMKAIVSAAGAEFDAAQKVLGCLENAGYVRWNGHSWEPIPTTEAVITAKALAAILSSVYDETAESGGWKAINAIVDVVGEALADCNDGFDPCQFDVWCGM